MDSGDESDASKASKKSAASGKSAGSGKSAASSGPKPVPIEEVETLGQMALLAPSLEKRLKSGEVRTRELCAVTHALERSKYFDADLLTLLWKELKRIIKRRQLTPTEIVSVMCSLSGLNAYDEAMFEAACSALAPEVSLLSEADKARLLAALKKVNHDPGEEVSEGLQKTQRKGDGRAPCPMFWRGQCKWGPKCKLSHDQDSFDSGAKEGVWKPPTQSGGKSVGYNQSSDLFKADRCGALW